MTAAYVRPPGGVFDHLGWGPLRIVWDYHPQRHLPAPWLLTIEGCHPGSRFMVQARAVVNDFGDLVVVGGWQ